MAEITNKKHHDKKHHDKKHHDKKPRKHPRDEVRKGKDEVHKEEVREEEVREDDKKGGGDPKEDEIREDVKEEVKELKEPRQEIESPTPAKDPIEEAERKAGCLKRPKAVAGGRRCHGLFIHIDARHFNLDGCYSDYYLFLKGPKVWRQFKGGFDDEGSPLVNGEVPDWYTPIRGE